MRIWCSTTKQRNHKKTGKWFWDVYFNGCLTPKIYSMDVKNKQDLSLGSLIPSTSNSNFHITTMSQLAWRCYVQSQHRLRCRSDLCASAQLCSSLQEKQCMWLASPWAQPQPAWGQPWMRLPWLSPGSGFKGRCIISTMRLKNFVVSNWNLQKQWSYSVILNNNPKGWNGLEN